MMQTVGDCILYWLDLNIRSCLVLTIYVYGTFGSKLGYQFTVFGPDMAAIQHHLVPLLLRSLITV
jgi:hypothetical protein